MTIEETIKKAKEGGYDNENTFIASDFFLDPAFWQSLGKAMGWHDDMGSCDSCFLQGFAAPKDCGKCRLLRAAWRMNWHHFIDHLAQGKTAEDFFKDL